MATASSSPPSTKGKTAVDPPTGDAAGADEGTRPVAAGRADDAVLARRRRAPLLLMSAAAAALAAAAYGHFVLGMRFGPPLVMVALGGMTLALGAGALWRVIDPLTRAEALAVTETARAPHRIRELEREKQAVLKAIKEIELDYQMRKISEGDYREMVERYRTRALRVMGDLAMGDDYRALIERELKHRLSARAAAGESPVRPAEPAAIAASAATVGLASPSGAAVGTGSRPDGVVCGACSRTNDRDAQYCKQCGQKLGSVAAPA